MKDNYVYSSNFLTQFFNPYIVNLGIVTINQKSYHTFPFQTYHEVIDEIYYKVDHLEPWERGSRKTSGQTGMCGGVRGVGAGGK